MNPSPQEREAAQAAGMNAPSFKRFRKSAKAFLATLADKNWHTFNGRKEKMIWGLGHAGLVEYRYWYSAPSQPTRMDVRLATAATPKGGHVEMEGGRP